MEMESEPTVSGPIVAMSESESSEAAFTALEQRLRGLEEAVDELRGIRAGSVSSGRKTFTVDSVLAKGNVTSGEHVDEVLQSLSIEQRIAVKSGLMRAGLM